MQPVLAYVAARLIDKDGNPIEASNPLPTAPPPPAAAPVIKFARIAATADGNNLVVAAVAGKKIRVFGYVLTVTAAGAIALQDTAGTPNVLAQFALAANGGASYAGGSDAPAFETAAGEGLVIQNPPGVDTLGHFSYLEAD